MTKTMKDLLRRIYGPLGGQVGDNPKARCHVTALNKREWKAARELEELGILKLESTQLDSLFTVVVCR